MFLTYLAAPQISSTERVHGMPHFNSKRGAKVWEQSIDAYSHLKSASFTVMDNGRPVKVSISGVKAAQSQRGLQWSYDGLTLRMRKGKKLQRWKIKPTAISDKVGAAIDPFLLDWAVFRNPVRALASENFDGRLAGSVVVNGVTCDVVELKGQNLQLSVLIRKKDHLLARSTSRILGANGKLSSADREFHYLSIGRSLPASAFLVK